MAILYNPPKFFEPFWAVVKPFLETKTQNKGQLLMTFRTPMLTKMRRIVMVILSWMMSKFLLQTWTILDL